MLVRHLAIVCLAGLGACATTQPASLPLSLQGTNPPEWVTKGSGAFALGSKDAQRVFYGVGMSSGIQIESLARDSADNHAINAIQKEFDTYTASLMKEYQASTTAGDQSHVSEEQHVEQALKTFTAGHLAGVQVVDRWQNPRSAAWYSLAKMDLATFAESMQKMRELNSQVRDWVRQNADRMHGELEKEEAKQASNAGPSITQ